MNTDKDADKEKVHKKEEKKRMKDVSVQAEVR